MSDNIESLERELAELKAAQEAARPKTEETTDEVVTPPVTPQKPEEEKNLVGWEKRYGDLRRHTQKKEEELQAKINALEARLSEPQTSQIMPTSPDELQKWISSNPALASVISTLVEKQATTKYTDLDSKLKELEEAQEATRIEKEKNKIRAAHADFDTIVGDKAFHEWVASQIKGVQDAIYDGSPDEVIWGLKLYKQEKGIKTSKDTRSAAAMVNTPSSVDAPATATKGRFSESMVEKMSAEEYNKHKDEIHAAMKNGTFNYDISGAAR